ncbi:MAG: hypothetical protein NW201_03015 [Gemmatimonadales bacterium]|nr:hypothetical protein [Gemmatimonadales bacterium]
MSNLPQRIDRAALDRILRRAAELQAAGADVGDGLSADEVIALGKEVGIPEAQLRQAMLEEASGPVAPASTGLLDDLVGPGTHSARRVVRGTVAEVEARLLAWMSEHEILGVQRHVPGRITWEPLGGLQAALRRGSKAMAKGTQSITLDRALVTATTMELEPGYCLVTLTADLRSVRSAYLGGGAAVASVGAAGTLVLSVLGAFWVAPLVLGAATLGAGLLIARTYRTPSERAAIGLERALDHLERHGGQPLPQSAPSLGEALVRDVGRLLRGS